MTMDQGTLPHLLADLAEDLARAAAVARAAATCAQSGALTEAMSIAIRLDIVLGEAQTLHAAVCLIARRAGRCGSHGSA